MIDRPDVSSVESGKMQSCSGNRIPDVFGGFGGLYLYFVFTWVKHKIKKSDARRRFVVLTVSKNTMRINLKDPSI